MPTGYGTQTALLLPRLAALGHKLAVSITAGQDSHPGTWRGRDDAGNVHAFPILPKTPYADLGLDVVNAHYGAFDADLVVTFLCTWLLEDHPELWRPMRTVHLTAVDCEPMSYADYAVIVDSGGLPAAISRFGERMMRAGGEGREPLDPLFLPHGVDTRVFCPAPDRAAVREAMNLDTSTFVVGMNFMNNDRDRKNIDQAIRGFARFHVEHPDSVLAIHAIPMMKDGIIIPRLVQHLGIADAVAYSPLYDLVTGMITPEMLADWYSACDVLLNIGNEGFGLPAIEAQACGTPVILGNWTTGPELVGDGWLVKGQERWNDKHRADWGLAFVDSVADTLSEAYEDAGKRRDTARDNALTHDIGRVVREHWEPVLGDLG